MLKIEITLSWNDFPFLAGCLAHQTSAIDHLRLLRLELPSANLCIGFLRDILGPNFSWALLIPCPSVVCFPWFPCTDCNKRGLQQTSRAGGVLGQKSVTSACLPPFSAAVHCTPWYQGVTVWFELRSWCEIQPWMLSQPNQCTCGCGSAGVLVSCCWRTRCFGDG